MCLSVVLVQIRLMAALDGDNDMALYEGSDAGVTVYLDGTAGIGGHAQGDTLANIERLRGSEFDDILHGAGGDDRIHGLDGGDVINGNDGDDRLNGNFGNDTLNGGGGDDWLTGGNGADQIDGGAGTDTANYGGAFGGVTVYLDGTAGIGASAAGDTLANIENIRGSAHNDTLNGDSRGNILDGGAGDDILNGGSGIDTLIGGAGADQLDGGAGIQDWADYSDSDAAVQVSLVANAVGTGGHAAGDTFVNIEAIIGSGFNDTLTGNSSRNWFESSAGADAIDGGGGGDIMWYITSDAGITIVLDGTTAGIGGHAAGDVLTNIADVEGSVFDDNITGSASNNTIRAGDGNDQLDGGAGDDDLYGGRGNDYFYGSAGGDYFSGGAGVDTADYSASSEGITFTVNGTVGNRTGRGGDMEGDRHASIEIIIASAHDDNLTGDGNGNTFYGGDGNDTLSGAGGDDVLDGGNGTDTLTGGDGIDRFALKLDTAAGTDTITDFSVGDGDRLLVDTANGNETTLAGLGITAQANGSNSANADLVYSNTVIATLNGIDHNDITDANFASYFEVI